MINLLYKDILLYICYKLKPKSILSFCLTNKKYKPILDNNTFWRNKVFCDFSNYGHNLENINKNLNLIKNKKLLDLVNPKNSWKKYYKCIFTTDLYLYQLEYHIKNNNFYNIQVCLNDNRCFSIFNYIPGLFMYSVDIEIIELLWNNEIIQKSSQKILSDLCIFTNCNDILIYLLKNNYVKLDDIYYILKLLCKTNCIEILKIALDNKDVDPSFDNNYLIKKTTSTNFIKILLSDKRVDPSVNNNYPLEMACKNGHIDNVKLLLSDSRVNPTDNNNACFKFAINNNHNNILKLLSSYHRLN